MLPELEYNAGRWIAELREVPGCLVYGSSPKDAIERCLRLHIRMLADEILALTD